MALPPDGLSRTLFERCSVGEVEHVRSMWVTHPEAMDEVVNQVDGGGNSPLHWACAHGHTEVARFLLDAGASIDAQNESNHSTPLIFAAANNKPEVVILLLQRGANTELRGYQKMTAVERARENGYDEIALLFEAPIKSASKR